MTYLEIINEVLKRLREDTVSTATFDTYSTLISTFVKQAYIEVANAYDWPQLDETQDVSISSGDTSFTITGDSGEGIHRVHSVYNSTKEEWLRACAYRTLRDKLSDDDDANPPREFSYAGETATSTTTFYIYPKSDASYTLKVNYNRKPDHNNTLSDSTHIKVPELPVILKAYALAVSERGEDGGAMSNEIDQQAYLALGDAISLYESNNNYDNMSWYVV